MTTLRVFHRATAIIVVLFVVAHLSNHLAALASLDAHLRLMEQLRLVYRQPVIEVFLLGCVSLQALTGLRLVWLRRKTRSGVIELLQAASGAYMALFLLIHVAAVLVGRAVYGLDTNFHYAAAGLHVYPFQYFFAPYYFLAVTALFAHLGCAVSWYVDSRVRVWAVGIFLCIGVALSTLICAALMGKVYPYEVPERYKNTYRLEQAN